MNRTSSAFAAAVVCLLAAAGCTVPNNVEPDTAATQAATPDDKVYAQYAALPQEQDCGSVDVGLGTEGSISTLAPEALKCFQDAANSNMPAQLTVESLTDEGDPIVSIWRIEDQDHIRVYVDATRDKFGPQRWYTHRCTNEALLDGDVEPDPCGPASN